MLAAIFSFAGVLYHLLGGAFGRISRSGPGSNHGTVAPIFSFWAAVLFVGSAVALGIGAATEASGSDNDDESNEEEAEDDDDDDDDDDDENSRMISVSGAAALEAVLVAAAGAWNTGEFLVARTTRYHRIATEVGIYVSRCASRTP
jgi:hypothetical protein